MFMRINERKMQCSKCESFNIVKPANENKVWVFKCLDCGHTKDYKESITTTASTKDMGWFKAEDLDKPETF